MHFWIKIFVVTIAILLVTLLLNSILSISSFEKIYARSLISTMESAGTHLGRAIEPGIRLGKPLKAFEGMDDLLDGFLRDNPTLANAGVSDADGNILYFRGAGDADRDLFSDHAREHSHSSEVFSTIIGNIYLIHVPLLGQDGAPVGAALASFSRNVVHDKLLEMARGAMSRLGWSLGITSIALVALLVFFVMRPIHKDLARIHDSLLPFLETAAPAGHPVGQAGAAGTPKPLRSPAALGFGRRLPDFHAIRNDILRLGVFLNSIALEAQCAEQGARKMLDALPVLETCRTDLLQCSTKIEACLAYPDQRPEGLAALRQLAREIQEALAVLEQVLALGRNLSFPEQAAHRGPPAPAQGRIA